MKVRLVLAVAALQVLVLAFMAGQREWISRTGRSLILRTAPIDPNDPMRGAYVRLDYEISVVPPALCRGETLKWTKIADYREQRALRDQVVYAVVLPDAHGMGQLMSLSDTEPDSDPFIRGRVVSADANGIRVRYGIEALFMAKTAAQKMESMALKERAGAPINAHIAVGPTGISVLKDHAWEPLGLTVTLHNYGDRDLAIVNLPEARSFRMVPNLRLGLVHYQWAGENSPDRPAPKAEDIIVLKPGAKHAVHLDLTQPQWWIVDTRKPGSEPIPLQKVPAADGWSTSFRIEYAPPAADTTRGLPHADLIRHAPLRSRAFNANQGVD